MTTAKEVESELIKLGEASVPFLSRKLGIYDKNLRFHLYELEKNEKAHVIRWEFNPSGSAFAVWVPGKGESAKRPKSKYKSDRERRLAISIANKRRREEHKKVRSQPVVEGATIYGKGMIDGKHVVVTCLPCKIERNNWLV